MNIPLLQDITIIFIISLVVLFFCHKIKIPVIVGLLISGIIAGPFGLKLIKSVHEVEALAEVGVVLLLFTIGLEFSFKELTRLKKPVLLGGSLQVMLTIVGTFAIARALGIKLNSALFMGFLVALSSTAIVLKIFQERAEMETPHGQTALAILIFQDIIVVLMMLMPPILSGSTENIPLTLGTLFTKGIAVMLLVVISARYIVPQILYQITRTRNRELFLLCICAIVLAIAWLTSSIGLSLGLGAFLAGLIISESEYSLEALGGIRPFRDVFTSFFFISIGMLLDLGFVADKIAVILPLSLGVLMLKLAIIFMVCWILKLQFRTTIIVSLSLCQIGEFSFILSQKGIEHHLIGHDLYQLFLSFSVVTMFLAPFFIALSPKLANTLLQSSVFQRLALYFQRVDIIDDHLKETSLVNHLIIVGFGENGRMLAQTAKAAGIPYLVIEMNTETVREQRKKGEPFLYGDATHEALLEHAHIKKARVLVVATSDPLATRHIVQLAKDLNPNLHIIARTRFSTEMEDLYKLGAGEVIPADFETAVEIFTRTLIQFMVPQNDIERFVADIRANGYKMLRSISKTSPSVCDLRPYLMDLKIRLFRVEKGTVFHGKSIVDTGLRKQYNVTLLAVQRGDKMIPNPLPAMEIVENDLLVVIGTQESMIQLAPLFQQENTEPSTFNPEKRNDQ